jgi:hypothetical protein
MICWVRENVAFPDVAVTGYSQQDHILLLGVGLVMLKRKVRPSSCRKRVCTESRHNLDSVCDVVCFRSNQTHLQRQSFRHMRQSCVSVGAGGAQMNNSTRTPEANQRL